MSSPPVWKNFYKDNAGAWPAICPANKKSQLSYRVLSRVSVGAGILIKENVLTMLSNSAQGFKPSGKALQYLKIFQPLGCGVIASKSSPPNGFNFSQYMPNPYCFP